MDAKKILMLLLLSSGMALSACSSSDSESDDESPSAQETLDGDTLDGDVGDSDIEVSENDDAMVAEETDQLPDEPLMEGDVPPSDDIDGDYAANDGGGEPLLEESSEEPPADSGANDFADSAPSPDSGAGDMFSDVGTPPSDFGNFEPAAPAPAPTGMVSVKKMATVPYSKNGHLLNTIYFARSGDDMESIATKLYGSPDNKSKLLEMNPNLKKGVKVGDKVYYNSPNRPDDSNQVLVYYEDIGIPPQTHTAAGRENIRDFAKQTYGDRNSWKEIYAVNPDLESKGDITEGTQFRFWGSDAGAGATPPMANNDMPPPMEEAAPPPPPPTMANNDIPPPPPPSEDIPPPPPAMGSVEPPPPPPPRAAEPPPPPPPRKRTSPNGDESGDGGLDQETTFMLGAAGIGLFLLVALIAIRRKARAKKMRMSAGETQI